MYDVTPITSLKTRDCGPTCLQMLLKYYGIEVELDQLIEECHVKYNGCTGKDLKLVGNAHGLDMIPYKMDAAELIEQDRPAIIWWKYCHWCVFAGKNEAGDIVICNPDRGRYPLKPETFTAFYTGVALFNGEPQPTIE